MIDYYYLKIGLVVLGSLIILSNLIDVQGLISKIIFRKRNVIIATVNSSNKQSDFLEIVSLWYQLKNRCDQFKLKVASDKLDEVFPLLNEVLDDDKVS